MRKNILYLLSLIAPCAGMAQDKTWSLDECIRYALEHQPRQAQQKAQNEIYRLDRREALGAFFPSLNAGSGASMNFGRGLDPETNTYISTNTFSNAYEIYSSLTLFDGLAQYYRVKMANVRRLMGDEELRTLQDKTTFEVMELYFNVLYYKGTVDLADRQWSESAAHLRKYRRMEELGLTSIPDLAEAQAKEAEDRFLLTRQTNLYNLERIRLKEKMNLPADDDLLVDDYTPEPAVRPAPDSARTICQTALPALPAVQASAHALAAAELEYRIARGRLLPSLSMNAGFGTSFSRLMDGNDYMPFWEQLKVREGAYVGFTLSIPLFNGLARTSELQRSRQRAVIARSRHEEVRRQAYSEIEQAVADVDGLADEYRHAQQRTAAMQSAHQLNVRKYETGLIDALALATSANRLLNARVEELYTRLKYHLKYRLLTYYKTIDNPR